MLRIGGLLCLAVALGAPAGSAASTPIVAVNDRGDVALVYRVLHQYGATPLYGMTAPAGGKAGPLEPLTVETFEQPAMASDEAGGAVAAWREPLYGQFRTRVMAATSRLGTGFSPAVELSEPGEHADWGGPSVDVNARGDAVVAWSSLRGVAFALRPAGGEFGPVHRVTTATGAGDVRVAIDASGGGVLLYPDDLRLHSTPFDAAGAVGPTTVLGGTPPFTDGTVLAANGRGDALLTWWSGTNVAVRERPAGGDWGPGTIATAEAPIRAGNCCSHFANAALNDRGDAVLIFGSPPMFVLARDGFQGAFASPQSIDDGRSGRGFHRAALALNERGDAAAAWHDADTETVRAAYRRAQGPFTAARRLAGPFAPRAPWPLVDLVPGLGIDGAGTASVFWEESDGEHVRIRRRAFDGETRLPATTLARTRTYVQEAPPESCVPEGDTVVARNDRAVVTVGPPNIYSRNGYRACLLGRGRPLSLSRLYGGDDGFDPLTQVPPKPVLAGPLAAYVVQSHHPPRGGADERYTSAVALVDLRDERSGLNRQGPALGRGWPSARVPVLRLARSGTMAWVACRDSAPVSSARCARSSRRTKHVYAFGLRTREPRRVDRGRRIAPGSLRIRGRRITWRNAGRLRSAPLR